ncbi:ankyrin repeat domain-containing protein 50-like [Camellia sinensis]|uniref:ankyrin repeat domain-containing protein 50-like n=1 Tax=Camellia sinensis TaxID=4442 RepID=UPI00103637CE|nr:ankyrin repeat domain-containing protein 50-like [Camellia sinensis]
MDRLVKADVKEVNLTFTRGQKSTATFRLTNLMHTMSVAVSLSTTNPSSLSFPNPFSILPPLSTSSFTLHLSSDHPPLSSPPDTILVRSSMLPTGKAHQDDLRRLFSKPGAHIFKDATIPISLVGPHVIESLFSPPYNKSLEVSFLLSKAISGCDESEIMNLLRSATGFGNSYFVSALIDAGADINHRDSNGQSVVSLAVQSGNIDSVQVLIESGFVIDHSIDRFLHDAAAINRADLMKLLFLGFGDIDVNSIDSQGRAALHVAAIHGHVEVLRFLVSMGGNPDAVDYNRWTLLHCAASEGHHEAVEFLLNCSMFVKYAVNEDGKTAFALAVEKGYSHLYDMLHLGDALQRAARIDDVLAMKSCIAEGVNVNGKDQNGWTALHRAAFKGRIESVKTLVSNGAQIDLLDDGGYTPLRRAVERGHMQVAIYLMAHGAKANVVKSNGSLKGFEMVPFNLDCFKNHPSLVTTPLC